MKTKLLELALEFYELAGLETSSKQAKKIEKEIGVWVDAYENELNEIIESRARAKKAREEAIILASKESIGAGVLPFLARQKIERGEAPLDYKRAQKFSHEAQKIEFLLKLWSAAKEAGGLKRLMFEDVEGRWDITFKSLVALYNATKECD